MATTPLPSWFGPFAARPKLVLAMAGGLMVALATRWIAGLHVTTAVILGWDALCAGYIATVVMGLGGRSSDEIRARAALDDEGRGTILTLVLAAVVAAVVAVALELSLAKNAHGTERVLRVALAFATVAASWFMVHLIFALHYAHGYYDREGEGDARGLQFPGGAEPDYWDFLHFSLIIGVAGQTADIAICAKPLRRLNTVHAVFSFAFNTVIVALTINLLASLFS
jgi:uncharacterized membrane protein